MEMIVVFNAGRDAAKRGAPRFAPDYIDYPGYGRQFMESPMRREWLRGYDKPHIPNCHCEHCDVARAG